MWLYESFKSVIVALIVILILAMIHANAVLNNWIGLQNDVLLRKFGEDDYVEIQKKYLEDASVRQKENSQFTMSLVPLCAALTVLFVVIP